MTVYPQFKLCRMLSLLAYRRTSTLPSCTGTVRTSPLLETALVCRPFSACMHGVRRLHRMRKRPPRVGRARCVYPTPSPTSGGRRERGFRFKLTWVGGRSSCAPSSPCCARSGMTVLLGAPSDLGQGSSQIMGAFGPPLAGPLTRDDLWAVLNDGPPRAAAPPRRHGAPSPYRRAKTAAMRAPRTCGNTCARSIAASPVVSPAVMVRVAFGVPIMSAP